MKAPVTLSDIAAGYDAILCDVWGVIRDGRSLLPDALDALRRFREQGGHVALLSNSPRRSSSLQGLLTQMGAGEGAWDAIVTSGDATHALLSSLAPGPAYKLGPDWDDPLYEGTGLAFAPLSEAKFISCTGLVDFETETVAAYADFLSEAKLRGLPMVCANPDKVVQSGDRLLPCGGALAEAYEALGGETLYAGKPHPPIYDLARAALETADGAAIPRERLLAIGDGPGTDLAGANREGIDVMFVTAGILSGDFVHGFDPRAISQALETHGVFAEYAAPSLTW